MNHSLVTLFKNRIREGLKRSSISNCSDWAIRYRVMGKPRPGNWSFQYHPWLREMHNCQDDMIGQKSAQMGFTEVALNLAFYTIDIHGESVLYILPANKPDATDFSTSRFDPALELSPHLKSLFSDVKNIGHKRAGSASLFIRGSRSRSQLKSLPVSLIIGDEVAEMNQDNLKLAFERQSGQSRRQKYLISTPTIEDCDINSYFKNSTQDQFFFKCPHSNKWINLTFPECLVITADDPNDPNIRNSHLISPVSKKPLLHSEKPQFLSTGHWVPSKANAMYRGFHVNQLYSCMLEPYEIAKSYLLSLTNPTDEQEFYNNKLGLTHEVKGARITDATIDQNIGSFLTGTENISPNKIRTLGIDVGTFFHYVIMEWTFDKSVTPDINALAIPKVIAFGKHKDELFLDTLMKEYKIHAAVIDMQPETRIALQFAQRFYPLVRLCHYDDSLSARDLKDYAEESRLNANRTSWLDITLGRYTSKRIILPKNIDVEFREHIKAQVRVYKKDEQGNPIARYQKADSAGDHYAHASNYAEIALPLAARLLK